MATTSPSCCAACGIVEKDDVTLKNCTACYLVKYCGIKCQKDHRKHHKRECKKRAAELRDELLFKQPESTHYGDCPICTLPLSLDNLKSTMYSCCSKYICDGCRCANEKREDERRIEHTCPFCREPVADSLEESSKSRMKRIEANDPVAMRHLGVEKIEEGGFTIAFEWFAKAAELGDVEAHYFLSNMYHNGEGVEKNWKKENYHLEEAAIGGHHLARFNLGCEEWKKGNTDRALKHFMIAAALGDDKSIKALMHEFKNGNCDKSDLDAALRAHQAAIEATKSPQREMAKVYHRNE